jgi:hypothetical protein
LRASRSEAASRSWISERGVMAALDASRLPRVNGVLLILQAENSALRP